MKVKYLTILAIAIIALLTFGMLYPLYISGYAIEFASAGWTTYKQRGDYIFAEGGYSENPSSIFMPIASDITCYGGAEQRWWIIPTGISTYAKVTLGKDGKYGITATHGDQMLLTPGCALWEYEKDWMGANKTNPYTISVIYETYTEDLGGGKTRTHYEKVDYKIYRFWSSVSLTISGEQLDITYTGYADAKLMRLSLEQALSGINQYSKMHDATIVLKLSINPMAYSSNLDWYGFLGVWVAGKSPSISGTEGGSTARIDYEVPHTVMAMYRNKALTDPAYRPLPDWYSLDAYTIDMLKNIPKNTLSDTVFVPIKITDMGVAYSTKDGDPSNFQSFLSYGGRPSLTLNYVYDVITTSKSTWFIDYSPPEPPTTALAGHITGVIKNEFGMPIGGAYIRLEGVSGYSATSDSSGFYQILNVPSGEYVIIVSKPGYEEGRSSVYVQTGRMAVVNITLTSSFWWLWSVVIIAVLFSIIYIAYKKYAKRSESEGSTSKWIALIVGIMVIGLYFMLQILQNLPWWLK